MKYVITGATSFLGQELIRTLAQSGAEVYAVCRTADKLRADVRELCTPIELQLSEYAALPEQITNADVFIHLAWDGTGHEGHGSDAPGEPEERHGDRYPEAASVLR